MPETIKQAAKGYWIQGFAVVPVKGKRPLVAWERWLTWTQTAEEFEGFPWAEADGFAVICGSQSEGGLFFAAIDFDVKNLPSEVVEKGRQVLKYLPITQIEQTPTGGLHYIYWAKQKPKSISAYHNTCGLELIGEGKLLIMAPSRGYKRLNDNTPTTIDNLQAVFYEALEKAGIQVKPTTWFNEKVATGYKGPEPPCIKALIGGVEEGLRNEVGIRLASYLVNFRGLSRSKALAKLQAWNSRNRPPLP